MPFRKHPTYVRKARNGYQLQRGVPKDVQPVFGKTVWVEGAGSTYRVAQRLSPAFAAKTDRLIAEARNEVSLTGDELIDSVSQWYDLSDPDVVELLLEGSDVAVKEGLITSEQESRYRAVVKREEQPRQHLSKEELIQHAKALKAHAARTEMSLKSALDDSLAHVAVIYPTAATTQHAVAYCSWLLSRHGVMEIFDPHDQKSPWRQQRQLSGRSAESQEAPLLIRLRSQSSCQLSEEPRWSSARLSQRCDDKRWRRLRKQARP